MYLRGQVLRDSKTPQVSHQHDEARGGVHVARLLGVAGHHLVRTHLQRMVHDNGEQRVPTQTPRTLRVQGEQDLRDTVVEYLVLDTLHDHEPNLPRDLQRGQQAGKADAQ